MVKKFVSDNNDLINYRWKSEPCFAERKNGEDCWCACVVPEEKLFYEKFPEDEADVIPYGSVTKEVAEHIVKIHNEHLERINGSDAESP